METGNTDSAGRSPEVSGSNSTSASRDPYFVALGDSGRLNDGRPTEIPSPHLGNLYVFPEKGEVMYDEMKGLERGRLPWLGPVGSKCHHECSSRRKTEDGGRD